MLRSLPFGRTVLVLLALGFLALFAIGGASTWLATRVRQDAARVGVSDLVRGEALQVYVAVREAEAAQRGFLLTEQLEYLQTFRTGEVNAPMHLNRLEALTRGDAPQQATIAELRPLLTERFSLLERTIELARSRRRTEAVEIVASGRGAALTGEISTKLGVIIQRETAALAASQQQSRRTSQLLLISTVLAAVLVAGLALVTLTLIGRALAELRYSARELKRANEGLEGQVQERTEEIRRANEEIQRFAYIVSHDLRSPLVNVMGFTSELESAGKLLKRQIETVETRAPELLDQEARLAVEEDLPEAVSFIRTSTAKMDRLISAILKLSRDGRRVLTPAPVVMTALVRQIADSLAMQADAATAEIVVEAMPDLVSDRLAIEQIFSNLIENAVKYLSPDRPGRIVVRGRQRGTLCVYEIEDNGRGIAPQDRQRVFELFRRAGVQDKPGEGLGLAFVQTNVRRLGGTIALASELGQGSTFTLTFPAVLRPMLREEDQNAA
jgi:signal transduction histidine kinase